MFAIETQEGKIITGQQVSWDKLPRDTVVRRLMAKISIVDDDGKETMVVADDEITGFEAYGFQMYMVSSPSGAQGMGLQLIGLSESANTATIMDFNLVTGARRLTHKSLDQLTYNRDLVLRGLGM